jgi:hypothetical protein
MKLLFKKILKNTFNDLFTSLAGVMAGGHDLISGISEKEPSKIIKGTGLILLGFIINSKK